MASWSGKKKIQAKTLNCAACSKFLLYVQIPLFQQPKTFPQTRMLNVIDQFCKTLDYNDENIFVFTSTHIFC